MQTCVWSKASSRGGTRLWQTLVLVLKATVSTMPKTVQRVCDPLRESPTRCPKSNRERQPGALLWFQNQSSGIFPCKFPCKIAIILKFPCKFTCKMAIILKFPCKFPCKIAIIFINSLQIPLQNAHYIEIPLQIPLQNEYIY